MRHRIAGRHLNRTTSHRRALRRNLAASLIEHGAIRTTPAKAKEVRPFVERLITIARKGTLHARRRVIAMLQDRAMVEKENRDELAELTVVQKLFEEIAPRFAERPGGYTRIIRLPERRIGDSGEQVLLQLVEAGASAATEAPETRSARRKRAARRAEAARAVEEEAETAESQEEAPGQAEETQAEQQGQDDQEGEAEDEKAEK
jgi:large subunit ribosomal protein L17